MALAAMAFSRAVASCPCRYCTFWLISSIRASALMDWIVPNTTQRTAMKITVVVPNSMEYTVSRVLRMMSATSRENTNRNSADTSEMEYHVRFLSPGTVRIYGRA